MGTFRPQEKQDHGYGTSPFDPEILFSRRAQKRHMARAAKAFSAISLGAAFAFTAVKPLRRPRASTDNPFTTIDGTPLGFTEDGDLRVMLASGEE